MDNQHRQIKGYRELSAEEIALMNEVKSEGERLGKLIEKIKQVVGDSGGEPQRWAEAARMDLQTGLMKLTRAIAQPTFF